MSQKTRIIWGGAVMAACLGVSATFLPALLRGDSRNTSPPGKLVVHEWGTFTSFAGTNGVNLEFRPLVTNDLPRFVLSSIPKPGGQFIKSEYSALQRMETPVTYFYTDVPRTVNVRVDFPKGMLTEWYPMTKQAESGQATDKRPLGNAFLDWGAVRLTPQEQFANVRVKNSKGEAIPAYFPPVAADDHYGRARETDSAIVETLDSRNGSYFEKFLFYRGIGNFELPIKLVSMGNDKFQIANTGSAVSGALLMVRIENEHVRFTRVDPIAAHAEVEVNLPTAESTVDQLADATVRELKATGLYEKEALSMVNTWRTSWFGENGTRLLYMVSGKLTDELLPLTVEPAPDERVRVLVGRLETITPEDGQRLIHSIVGSEAGAPTEEAVAAELAKLGRFAEPAVQSLLIQTNNTTTRGRLEAVLAGVRGKK